MLPRGKSMEMTLLKPVLISLALAGAVCVPAALAAPMTPEAAADVLRNAGDTDVNVTWVSDTAARIDSNKDGIYYSVRLFACDEQKSCSGAMIFATYAEPGTLDLSVHERNNAFNDSYPFGRGFVLAPEENDGTYTIGLDYSIDISDEANFDNGDVDLFFTALDAYVTHMESTD